jgi:hypothetical protein
MEPKGLSSKEIKINQFRFYIEWNNGFEVHPIFKGYCSLFLPREMKYLATILKQVYDKTWQVGGEKWKSADIT